MIRLLNGLWLLVSGQVATSDACCCDGCCCVDGASEGEMSQAECAELGGVFQGYGVSCEAGDCADTCCLPRSDCTFLGHTVCRVGYFASLCESSLGTANCDATAYNPGEPGGNSQCKDGVPTSVTFAISGVLDLSGSPYGNLADAFNQTFVVDIDECSGSGTVALSYTDPNNISFSGHATVTFAVIGSGGSWSVTAALSRNDIVDTFCGGVKPYASSVTASGTFASEEMCGGGWLADCTGYAGSYSATANTTYPCFGSYYNYTQVVDSTGATVDVS